MAIDNSPYANTSPTDSDEFYGRQAGRDARFTAKQMRSRGTCIANGTSAVTVADANFAAITSVVTFSLNTVGGTVGALPAIQTVTAGTGFTFKATASDTSTYNYMIIN